MKPTILKWIYLGLLCTILRHFENLYFSYYQLNPGPKYELPIIEIYFFIVMVFITIISVFGLIKKYSWSRWVSFGIIGFSSLSYLYKWVYVFIITKGEVNYQLEFIFGIALLFLSYKIFISETLRTY